MDVPERVDLVEELELVQNPAQSAVRNELMKHPLGKAALGARPVVPVPVGEGLSRECRAGNEFGNAPLGDKRLAKRLVDSARVGSAAFSFLGGGGRECSDRVLPLAVRATSLPRSRRRIFRRRTRSARSGRTCNTVLRLQDGTDLNFAARAQCGDLGVAQPDQRQGLHLRTTVDDTDLPLGLLKLDAPRPDCRKNASRGFLRAEAARRLDGTQLIGVMDREADFFEMFAEQRRLGNHSGARQAQPETVENGEVVR